MSRKAEQLNQKNLKDKIRGIYISLANLHYPLKGTIYTLCCQFCIVEEVATSQIGDRSVVQTSRKY